MVSANLGTPDRIIRLIVGVMALGLYGALPSPWRYLTLLGLVLIATSLSKICPLYRLLGISTCRG